jgi:mono/diheme cytochrome c family protein
MTKRRGITIAAAAVFLLGIGAIVFVGTGAYNVAATTAHLPVTRWLLNTVQERSIAARADGVPSPPSLDSGLVKHAFAEYEAMCVVCHGAPGMERGTLGKGMNPEPPDLTKVAAEWNDRELFWITKHGIKLAGMPAFGVTHSDKELWGIVAVLRRLQHMSAEDYRRSVAEAGAHGDMHGVVTESGGETQTTDAQPHAHPGTPASTAQQRAGTQGMNHSRMDHSTTASTSRRRAPLQASPHQEHEPIVTGRAAKRPMREAAQVDVDGTEKLKTLAAELLRDPIVLERIRADSALRRRWENPNVRKQLDPPSP